jgi:hypothetical protein
MNREILALLNKRNGGSGFQDYAMNLQQRDKIKFSFFFQQLV